jgi:hypothetical protein
MMQVVSKEEIEFGVNAGIGNSTNAFKYSSFLVPLRPSFGPRIDGLLLAPHCSAFAVFAGF